MAAERLKGLVLEACPFCGAESLRVHDRRVRVVPLGDGTGADVEMREQRYACRECGLRITVLPDCLVPFGRYPSASRDFVIEAYLSGRCTHRGGAAVVSCSQSTSWRWVRALTWEAGSWVQTCREQVTAAGEAVGPLILPESKRSLWQRRRIRAAGMLEGLLLGEALLGWVERLRAAWRRRREVLPERFWSLCRHILAPLTVSQRTERHRGPALARMAPGGGGPWRRTGARRGSGWR